MEEDLPFFIGGGLNLAGSLLEGAVTGDCLSMRFRATEADRFGIRTAAAPAP